MTSRLDRVEIGTGVVLTGLAIYLRGIALNSAGALWRDEANTVGLATLPHLRDVWANLQFDSFPILWLLIVRSVAALAGPYNDSAFRLLGFIIGLGLITALWFNARALGYRVPLMALALFAVAPSVVIWGDSMRAYGLAMLLIFLTGSLIWRFVEEPSPARFAAALVVAVLSVQTVYYNSVVLLALCAGAFAACSLRRRWKTGVAVIGIGAVAALSLLPYIETIRVASSWNALVRIPHYTAEWFFVKLYECLLPGGSWTFVAWMAVSIAGALSAFAAVLKPGWFELSEKEREQTLFALVTLLVGSTGTFLFLRALSYYTQPWYYLTLLTIVAFSIDVLVGMVRLRDKRILRVVLVLAFGGGTFFVGRSATRERLTNVDVAATAVSRMAMPGDVIIINPWYYGVSFDRYYRGELAWRTVPDIPFHIFHRYDLVMAATREAEPAPIRNVIDDAESALQQGHAVFVVGTFSPLRTNPASGIPVAGDQAIQNNWLSLLRNSLTDVETVTDLPIATPTRVSRYENLRVMVLRGRQRLPGIQID